jgi:hypothetical protein
MSSLVRNVPLFPLRSVHVPADEGFNFFRLWVWGCIQVAVAYSGFGPEELFIRRIQSRWRTRRSDLQPDRNRQAQRRGPRGVLTQRSVTHRRSSHQPHYWPAPLEQRFSSPAESTNQRPATVSSLRKNKSCATRVCGKPRPHSYRYGPVRIPAFATLHMLSLSIASCRNIALSATFQKLNKKTESIRSLICGACCPASRNIQSIASKDYSHGSSPCTRITPSVPRNRII